MNVLAIFIVLPVVGALIGYTTKWTSVQLIFKPSKFVGVGPLGWQGVVQRRSPKFAAGVAATLQEVAPIAELLDRIEPAELAAVVADALADRLDTLAPLVLEQVAPGAWADAPDHVRAVLGAGLRDEVVAALTEVIAEAQPIVGELVDIDELVVELLSGENADRLARLLQTIGSRELRTVIRYGAVVGFFVGIAEAVVYLALGRWWLLPAIGALDGLVNNWMGIQMIFRPLERRRYLGVFPYQGLFPARQAQIAHDYGHMLAAEVLTPGVLAQRLQHSDAMAGVLSIARRVLERRLAPQLDLLAPAFGIESTSGLLDNVVDAALGALVNDELDLDQFPAVVAHLDEQLQIGVTIEDRLAAMDKLEFEKILRGIFEEDEPLLIGIGGVIGAAIGCMQAALVLGLHLGHG